MLRFLSLFLVSGTAALAATETLSSGALSREFSFDGKVWRTTALIAKDGAKLPVQSDEFHIRSMDDREWTVADYQSLGEPERQNGSLVFRYGWAGGAAPEGAPTKVTVRFQATGMDWIRKDMVLEFPAAATVDRLEVERMSAAGKAERGGRGEPVFVESRWFFGLEHPAGHSRHSDGNQPLPDAHRYEKVGNYSFVGLDDRDREAKPREGLLRLFHFPGYAKQEGGKYYIRSKTGVSGVFNAGETAENGFGRYLASIAKPDRSFTHYNNWFDGAGKSLKGDNFVKIHQAFKEALKPYDITLDAMVPDDGWQNRSSVWEPAAGHFPNGVKDVAALSEALRKDGTTLGLWLALDGTNTNVGWGEKQGFKKAKANGYFSRYFAHYSLSADGYRQQLEAQLRKLAGEAKISYFKHDFNHLSDTGEGCNHPATDRHGHEANVDAMIGLLAATREANPAVYQNLTNWVWFSPWWLMHGDALWMLAGDDGFNGNWPELSTRAMATTDRDAYIWRMWGEAADRPLVPISRLMTHGIIRNPGGQMESKEDTLRDWADHAMMYYGRGIQMKEWYLTPAAMSEEKWKSLATIHRWSQRNFKALANNRWVGGRPDEGHAYGYAGWNGERGVLVARNPGAAAQVLRVPFDAAGGYLGEAGKGYVGRVVYPYHATWAKGFVSGQTMEIEIPGYETLAFEFEPGAAKPVGEVAGGRASVVEPSPGGVATKVDVPADLNGRAELLVIGYPELPAVMIDGAAAVPVRTSKAAINHFASYAREGMPSKTARPWRMASYDVKQSAGKRVSLQLQGGEEATRVEAWLLAETKAEDEPFETRDLPWAIAANSRRHTMCVVEETWLMSLVMEPRALSAEEFRGVKKAWLSVDCFGVSEGYGAKLLFLNGVKVGELPAGADEWKTAKFELPADLLGKLKPVNMVELLTERADDKFKVRGFGLQVELADGSKVRSTRGEKVQTSAKDWAHFEGEAFPSSVAAAPVVLEFGKEE